MSQDLQTARYDQLVRRVGGLLGGGSKVTETLAEVFPVLELEDTTPELIALSGWRTAWQSTERSPNVALVSTSQLRNPAGSGVIAVVTQVGLHVTVPAPVQMQISTPLIGTPVPGLFRDSRFGVPRNTVCQVSSADGPVIGGGLRIRVPAAENIFLRDDNGIVVLTPGTTLSISTVIVNILMTVNYVWRERIALDSEINFP